ncbi:MAG: DoxX family protein [Cyanobacteria bacterium]|nr:DoxX family protein [Cyanobacteriota bacterium]
MTGKTQYRTGIVLTALPVMFLIFDSVIKFSGMPIVSQSMTELGYPVDAALTIGLIEIVCLALYVVPRTSVLGAVLLTGYLGGAIATHVRVGNPLFSHVLFPTYIAALLWAGLFLREQRLRVLLPLRAA